MFFKPIKHIALMIALTAGLGAGCSLRLNDRVTKPISTVNTGAACLAQTGEVLNRFSAGTLSAAEHEAFYSCVDRALAKFTDYASGKSRDFFTPSELSGFLTKFFFKGKELPPSLVVESMVLKQAMLGGPGDRLSRADLSQIRDFFTRLKKLTEVARPLMPLKAETFLARGFAPERFEESLAQLIQAVAAFGEGQRAVQSSAEATYTFDHYRSYIRELSSYLYGENIPQESWAQRLLVFSEALRPAKAILISPPRDEITQADWPKVYRLAPVYFAAFLRLEFYWHSPFSLLQTKGLRIAERLFADFVTHFEFVIDQHPGQVISSEEIDDLLIALDKQKLISCRPETAHQFIKVVFGRLFGEEAGDGFGITKASLSRLKENMRFAFEGLRANEALYRTKFGDHFSEGTLTREEIAAVPSASLLEATALKDQLSAEAVEALQRTPVEIHTIFGEKNLVVIPKMGEVQQISYLHMLEIFGLRSLNRLLAQGFGSPGQTGLSEVQIKNLLDQIFPILVELQLVSKSMRASISKRLVEASLFLYSSDGNRGLTMNKALELEALLLSTLEYAPSVHAKIAGLCLTAKPDLAGKALISGECYREKFLENAKEIWSYLPGLAEFMGMRTAQEQRAVFDSMARFLRIGKTSLDDFTAADTQSYVLLPYYVEMLFSRFDRNHDGLLDNAEAEVAYPVFQPFIAEKANAKGYTNPQDHLAIYHFLLAYRVLPTDDKWDFVLRRYLLNPKPFQANRSQVVEIFEKLLTL